MFHIVAGKYKAMSKENMSNEKQSQPSCLGAVSGWVSVHDRLPEILETVWVSNGKGWTTLGCRIDYRDGDNGELVWCWASINGIIYEEDGEIVAECEEDDLDVKFWHELPKPPTS